MGRQTKLARAKGSDRPLKLIALDIEGFMSTKIQAENALADRQLEFESAIYNRFGRVLRKMREKDGMTQDQLAQHVGLERTSITNIESGKQRVLLHDIFLFAMAFGSSPSELFELMETTE